jgi:hypothetical protein
MWQLGAVDLDERKSCMETFIVSRSSFSSVMKDTNESKSNENLGYFVWGGLIVDYARMHGMLEI